MGLEWGQNGARMGPEWGQNGVRMGARMGARMGWSWHLCIINIVTISVLIL